MAQDVQTNHLVVDQVAQRAPPLAEVSDFIHAHLRGVRRIHTVGQTRR